MANTYYEMTPFNGGQLALTKAILDNNAIMQLTVNGEYIELNRQEIETLIEAMQFQLDGNVKDYNEFIKNK